MLHFIFNTILQDLITCSITFDSEFFFTILCTVYAVFEKKKNKRNKFLGFRLVFVLKFFPLFFANLNESFEGCRNQSFGCLFPSLHTLLSMCIRSSIGLHNTSHTAKQNGLFSYYLYFVLLFRLELFSCHRSLDPIKRHCSLLCL